MEETNKKQIVQEEVENTSSQEPSPKKNLKLLWITIALAVVALIAIWCIIWAIKADGKGIEKSFKFSSTVVLFVTSFIVIFLGYLLGRISIKGVTLGTAGVFLIAILFGYLCTLDFSKVPLFGKFHYESKEMVTTIGYLGGPIQNLGLIMFVGSVGFIAGPNFFKDLKKNFKTYILLGVVIIVAGTLVALICTLITDYGPEFWSGVLSGALTSTPGYSAAVDAAPDLKPIITFGHAVAYPFGVVGVVLFVQLIPKFLKVDMDKERSLISSGATAHKQENIKLFEIEPFGFAIFGLAIILGLLLGSITIPLTTKGYAGTTFSLGTTGGVLIMCLIIGHLGKIKKFSLKVNANTLKVFKEFGLVLFLLGAGFEGGVELVEQIKANGGAIIAWGFLGGAAMTIVPMIVGFIIAKFVLKLPLLNNLGSITGGMTSTPALGTLIGVSRTDDVASAYASTYPIALVLVVLASQLLITLM